MSKKQIFIILSAPGNGGDRLAASLAAYAHSNDANIDLIDDEILPPTSLFNGVIDDLLMTFKIDPLSQAMVDSEDLTGSATRLHRLEMRKLAFGAKRGRFPIIFHHPGAPALIPFFREAFEETDIHLKFILVSTNALQVCDALAEKLPTQDGADNSSQSMLVWARSILPALNLWQNEVLEKKHLSQKSKKALSLYHVHYPQFLARPRKTLSALYEALSLKTTRGSETRIDDIAGAISRLDQSDRAYTNTDVERHNVFPAFIRDLNAALETLPHCEKLDHDKTNSQIEPLVAGYDDFLFYAANARSISQQSSTLQSQTERANSMLANVQENNQSLEQKVEALTRQNQELDGTRDTLNTQIKELQHDLESARNSNNEQIGLLSEENQKFRLTLEDNEIALGQMQTLMEKNRQAFEEQKHALEIENIRLTEQKKAAEALVAEIRKDRTHERQRYNIERATFIKQQKSQEETIASLREGQANHITPDEISLSVLEQNADHKKIVARAIAHAREEMRSQLQTEIEQAKRKHDDRAREAEQQILDQDARIAELKMEADKANHEVAAIKTSTSWKISAPVRGVKTAIRHPRTAAKSTLKGSARLVRTALSPFRARTGSPKPQTIPNRMKDGDLGQEDDHVGDVANTNKRDHHHTDGLEGYLPLTTTSEPTQKEARAIAFYLPQFHTIPENDEWWGRGFTEWKNVEPAKPQFEGHYQPHRPSETNDNGLGMYDLIKDGDILHRQTDLARRHGLSGFAFYFYWFAGKRLLEAPLLRYLEDKTIDFPFCLCWANENWSRRWDGRDNEILISQNHSPEDDIAFIEHLSQYLKDDRYIRVDGKPLILVYRPGILPSARATAERWRNWCRDHGIGDIYLAYTQGFEKVPPNIFGFDAAIEFPPNNHDLVGTPGLLGKKANNFKGKVFDWRDLVKRSQNYPQSEYKMFRGVTPSWDNTPRRGDQSTVLLNSNPPDYYRWLKNAITDTRNRLHNPDEHFVFINAWNEWAEGAHLEPDQKYGFAWLEATRRAIAPMYNTEISNQSSHQRPPINAAHKASSDHYDLTETISGSKKKIIIVTHDLLRHGAQFLSLNFAKTLTERYDRQVHIIACDDGPLRKQFEQYGPVTILKQDFDQSALQETLQNLYREGFHQAFINSAASGWLAPYFSKNNISFIGLVHEMKSIIESMGLEKNLQNFHDHARRVIFPATCVRDQAAQFLSKKQWHNARICPQGVYKLDPFIHEDERELARKKIIERHDIPANAQIILGVGFADHRKGIDIFVKWATSDALKHEDAHFIWVGEIAKDMSDKVEAILSNAGPLKSRVHLPGFTTQTKDYYLAADFYALTSREDPFPSTALEALNAQTPVIMIKGTGGIEDLTEKECVMTVKSSNAQDFAAVLLPLLANFEEKERLSELGVKLIREQFGFYSYVGDLLDELNESSNGVSCIIPNYNYERHLRKRITSIIEQKLSPREILFLDDASSDNSVALATKILADCGIRHRIIVNTENSGNVFAQWQKGVVLATQPIIWIAEADDWADNRFLLTLSPEFDDQNLVLAFSESRQINEKGDIIAPDYRDYVRDISSEKWTRDFKGSGYAEIAEGLAVKNTIPNASAALFRASQLQDFLDTDIEFAQRFRTAGDWYVYVNLLRSGALHFTAKPLNYHRRHDNSVTIRQFNIDDLTEIANMQNYIAQEFNLGAKERKAAQDYLKYLIQHFNLQEQYNIDELEKIVTNRDLN